MNTGVVKRLCNAGSTQQNAVLTGLQWFVMFAKVLLIFSELPQARRTGRGDYDAVTVVNLCAVATIAEELLGIRSRSVKVVDAHLAQKETQFVL